METKLSKDEKIQIEYAKVLELEFGLLYPDAEICFYEILDVLAQNGLKISNDDKNIAAYAYHKSLPQIFS